MAGASARPLATPPSSMVTGCCAPPPGLGDTNWKALGVRVVTPGRLVAVMGWVLVLEETVVTPLGELV